VLNLDHFLSINVFAYFGKFKRSWCKTVAAEIDYSEIAFTLAQSDSISESLSSVLAQPKLHKAGQQVFPNFQELFVLMTESRDKYVIHCADSVRSTSPVKNHLSAFQINVDTMNNIQPFLQKIDDSNFLFCPVFNENQDAMAYLVIAFKGHIKDQTQVDFYTSSLTRAIQRGLQAYQKRHADLKRAINNERMSQAADLHDSIAQVLSYLKLRSSSLKAYLYETDTVADDTMLKFANEIDNQVGFAHRLIRELITSSRLSFLQTDLADAIQNSMQEFEQLSGVVFDLDNRANEALKKLPYQSEILFIIRESLCNLVRHSHASHARIVITQQSQNLQVLIEDNGIGIQPESKRPDSFGLCIMEERARKMDAELIVENRKQGGTRVQLSIPREH